MSTWMSPVVFVTSMKSTWSVPVEAPGTCPTIFSCGASMRKSTLLLAWSMENFLASMVAALAGARAVAVGASAGFSGCGSFSPQAAALTLRASAAAVSQFLVVVMVDFSRF